MEISLLPFDFPGKIFRSAMPFSSYDPEGNLLHAYQDHGISMVVMLAGENEAKKITGINLIEKYKQKGFEVTRFPIEDFGVPEISKVRRIIPGILSHSKAGGNIVIHCHAGVGRTGMLMACLAKIGLGYSPEESIRWVREYIPGAVEVPEQEQLVKFV